jgi:hypothetical protein
MRFASAACAGSLSAIAVPTNIRIAKLAPISTPPDLLRLTPRQI